MALDKQNVPISFKSALNTKVDSKQLVLGELVTAENIVFDEGMAFTMRNGYKLIGNAAYNMSHGSYPGTGGALGTYNKELILFDGTEAWSYDQNQNVLLDQGFISSVNVGDTPIVRTAFEQTVQDSAISPVTGLQFFIWEDQNGPGVRYSIIDSSTGKAFISGANTLANTFGPRVVYYNGQFVATFLDSSGNLYRLLVPDTNPLVNVSPELFLNDLNTAYGYDTAVINGFLYFGYCDSTNSDIVTIKKVNTSFTIDGSAILNGVTNVAQASVSIFGVPNLPQSEICVATSGFQGVYASFLSYDLTSHNLTHVYSSAIANGAITGCVEGVWGQNGVPIGDTSEISALIFFTIPDPNAGLNTTGIPQNDNINAKILKSNTSYGASSWNYPQVMCSSVGLASKAVAKSVVFSGNADVYLPYVIGVYQSQFQTTYFLFPGQNDVAAKIFPNNAGGLPARYWALPTINQITPDILQVALLQKESLSVVHGVQYTPTGVDSVQLEFNNILNQFSNIELGNNLMIGGGLPQMYDGVSFVEHNFNLFPEGIQLITAPLGGALSPGVYQYQATYEWSDNQGQIHRSAPSIPISPSNGANNPAYDASIVNKLDVYAFSGKTVINTATIVTYPFTDPSVFRGDQIFPGCIIKDTGGSILPNTFITDIQYNTPGANQLTITISNAAAGSIPDDVFNVTYGQLLRGTVEGASNVIQLEPFKTLYVFGNVTNGSPLVTLFNLAGIRVGLTLTYSPYFSGSPTITAINTATNQITLSSNATSTSSIPTALPFEDTFTGSVSGANQDLIFFPSPGTNFDPGATALLSYAAANVGTNLDLADFVAIPGVINSASGTTINVDYDYTVNVAWDPTNDITLQFNEVIMGSTSYQLTTMSSAIQVGMKLVSNGYFPDGTYVVGVTSGIDIVVNNGALVHAFGGNLTYTVNAKGFFTGSGTDITGVDPAVVAWAAANIGGSIDMSQLLSVPSVAPIVSVSSPTIRLTMPYNSPATFSAEYPGNIQVILGQTITDAIPPDYIFTGTFTANTNTFSTDHATAVFAAANLGAQVQSEGLTQGPPYPIVTASDTGTNVITMSGNAINSGTSGVDPYNQSIFIFGTQPAFIGSPIITASYMNPTFPGVGVIEVDQKAQRSYPNSDFSDSTAHLILGNTYAVMATIPTLRITDKLDSNNPVNIVLYRSIANNTDVFYEVATTQTPGGNNPPDVIVDFDLDSDNTIAGGPGVHNSATQLYTTGGVLENSSGPACTSLTTYQNRLFGISTETPLQLFYSQQVVPGSPVQFTEEFTLNVDPRGGDCTSLLNMDDKLIVFKESYIFYMTGIGPNALGQQNDFSETFFITSDCGCVDPKSVVLMPAGIMFKSAKGIMLLSRSLQVSYIGAGVEKFNKFPVTSAQLIPSTNEVRFTLAGTDTVLVFDYFYGLWGTFTNIQANASAIFQGLFTWVGEDGLIHQETPNTFIDVSPTGPQAIIPHFTTGWMNLAGLLGFQRVYKMLLLGEYIGPHNLTVNIAYDFNPNFVQEDHIDTSTLLGIPFGDDASFGSMDLFGGEYPTYLWRVFMQKQKSTSIMFDIVATPTTPIGEAVSFSGMALEVGVMKGLNRVQAKKSSG